MATASRQHNPRPLGPMTGTLADPEYLADLKSEGRPLLATQEPAWERDPDMSLEEELERRTHL